jgi:hypothetical protein
MGGWRLFLFLHRVFFPFAFALHFGGFAGGICFSTAIIIIIIITITNIANGARVGFRGGSGQVRPAQRARALYGCISICICICMAGSVGLWWLMALLWMSSVSEGREGFEEWRR